MIGYRHFEWGDLDAAAALASSVMTEGSMTPEALRHQLEAPTTTATRDCFVAVTEDGKLVGLGINLLNPDSGQGMATAIVHADYRRKGIGSRLLALGDGRLLERAEAEMRDGLALYALRSARESETAELALLTQAGYEEMARTYRMRIVFDQPLEAADFGGVELRPFDPDRYGPAAYQAYVECFREHIGGISDRSYEEWSHSFTHPAFDPALWFIAWDGDQIAGLCQCEVWDRSPEMGWVEALGVRPAWRGRGLGEALLHHGFQEFQRRGLSGVVLEVHSANQTGAVALYEKVGMRVTRCDLHLIKQLRGDNDSRQENNQ